MRRLSLTLFTLGALSSLAYGQTETGPEPVVGAGAGTGSAAVHFGARITTGSGIRQFLFNLGTTSSKLKKDNLGSSLLTPGFDSKGFQIYLTESLKSKNILRPLHKDTSLYFRLTGSFADFEGTVSGENKTALGQIITSSLGFQYPFFSNVVGSEETATNLSFGIAAGVTYRTMIGDISQSNNSELRNEIVGAGTKRQLWSPEITLYLNMGNDVQPYVQYTKFGANIPSLSGERFTMGVRALTDFLKKPKSDDPTNEEDQNAIDAKNKSKEEDGARAAGTPSQDTKKVVDFTKAMTNKPNTEIKTTNDEYDKNNPNRGINIENRLKTAGNLVCYMDPKTGRCFLAEIQPVPFMGNPDSLLDIKSLNTPNVALQLRNNSSVLYKSDTGVFELKRKRPISTSPGTRRMKF
jgi:hypothetical protein